MILPFSLYLIVLISFLIYFCILLQIIQMYVTAITLVTGAGPHVLTMSFVLPATLGWKEKHLEENM